MVAVNNTAGVVWLIQTHHSTHAAPHPTALAFIRLFDLIGQQRLLTNQTKGEKERPPESLSLAWKSSLLHNSGFS